MVTTAAFVRDEMLSAHYPLARKIACRMYEELPKTLEVGDLINEAVLGLIEAIDRFDAEQGVPFENYARYRIRGAVVDAVRGEDWMPQSVRRKGKRLERARAHLAARLGREPSREELAAQLGLDVEELDTLQDKAAVPQVLSLDAPATEDGSLLSELVSSGADHFAIIETREMAAEVEAMLADLPDPERDALRMYYFDEMKLKAIGQQMGVSESRACQLCKKGLERLRRRIAFQKAA